MADSRHNERATPPDRLQQGIAYRSGETPAPYYRLVLLNASPSCGPKRFSQALREVDAMLHQLAAGESRELSGQPPDRADATREQFGALKHLVAFGRRLFDERRHRDPLVRAARPDHLSYLAPDGPFPSLHWEQPNVENRGEADVAIQLTGPSQAAVNCAAVEIWKLLEDRQAPLIVTASFDGFGRPDGRGWLEFHDGVSNLRSSQREAAIEPQGDPAWMAGGTYMAFLRITVDLVAWRALSRPEQEFVVGRDKLSGAPVTSTRIDESGQAVPVASPVPGRDADDRERSDSIEPPQTTDPIIEASHVHRASQNRGSPHAIAALRIFRQGYEFMETLERRPRLGLNFVSFQRDLRTLQQLLHQPGWLGDANFGGKHSASAAGAEPLNLCAVTAGGFYAAPPDASPFPGADICTEKL